MSRLKDRQRQIPGGFRFAIPELNYASSPFSSFDIITNSVFSVMQANPALASARGWPQTRGDVADWVDEFNANVCWHNGWKEYINGEPSGEPPKYTAPPAKLAALAGGAQAIVEWLGAGGAPVSSELAAGRAKVCVKCPLNQQGDLSNFFERATSELIRRQIASARSESFTTPDDNKLGVCSACYCPLRLKVHFPIHHIRKNLTLESTAALDANCWITKE